MASEGREQETPTMPLIVVRVTAEAATVEEFIARFARYFRDGDVVFVPTEGVQPSGRRVMFVFALKGGEEMLHGQGVVMRMRRDSGDPRRPPGMELRYEISDDASAAMVERLLAARATPPPYVSMRIDGVADSQELTLPIERYVPPPLPPPPLPSSPLSSSSSSSSPSSLSSPPPLLPSPPRLPSPGSSRPAPSRAPAAPSRTPAISSAPPPRVAPSPSVPLHVVVTTPSLAPILPPPSSRLWRGIGTAIATGAAVLAVTLAAALMRREPAAPPPPHVPKHAAAAVGGNGVVVTPLPTMVAAPAPTPPPVVAPSPPHPAGAPVQLRVVTSPSGARVFVDGEERGPSPLSVSVAAGAHDVVAERPRWLAAHAHVDGPGRVQLTLSRPQARLRIVSNPPGAAVRLDGRDVGVTPLELDADAYELHVIRFERDGRVRHKKIYLRPPAGSVTVGARGAVPTSAPSPERWDRSESGARGASSAGIAPSRSARRDTRSARSRRASAPPASP